MTNSFGRKFLATLAALLLAGAAIGCERETAEGPVQEEGAGVEGMEEPTAEGEMAEEPAVEEEMAEAEQEEEELLDDGLFGSDVDLGDAAEELAEGIRGDEEFNDVRDEVAEELGVDNEMLTVASDIRQQIKDAETEYEARGLAQVALAEALLAHVQEDQLDQEEQAAYQNAKDAIENARGILTQMGPEGAEGMETLEERSEEVLDNMSESFEEFEDKIDVKQRAPAGGGPIEQGQDDMMEQDSQEQQGMEPQGY